MNVPFSVRSMSRNCSKSLSVNFCATSSEFVTERWKQHMHISKTNQNICSFGWFIFVCCFALFCYFVLLCCVVFCFVVLLCYLFCFVLFWLCCLAALFGCVVWLFCLVLFALFVFLRVCTFLGDGGSEASPS